MDVFLEKFKSQILIKAKEINGSDMAFDFERGWSDFINHLKYVTCLPTVQTRRVPIQVHLWNLRRRIPVDILK